MKAFRFYTDVEIAKAIANRFKERRLFLNLTQEEVAKEAGTTVFKVRDFEQKGVIPFVDLIKLLRAVKEISSLEKFIDYEKSEREFVEMKALMEYEKQGKRKRARGEIKR